MKLSPALLRRAEQRRPGDDLGRIVLDRRGIHHKTVPARSFVHAVKNHAEEKDKSVAESLYIVERLKRVGALHEHTRVDGQGAIFQAFHGRADRQACHTMPCQLVLDGRFPHQLPDGDGKALNSAYLHRTINLFARCTWTPKIVNPIDAALDWSPESDFVTMYLQSVKSVLGGAEPNEVFRDFAWRRSRVLKSLRERLQDEPLSEDNAMLLMGALDSPEKGAIAMSPKEIDQMLADKQYLAQLQEQREAVIETYAGQGLLVPHNVLTSELKNEVFTETWREGE